jgi:putative addiction module killer protein
MIELRIYTTEQGKAPFEEWLNNLKDRRARAVIRARLERLRGGNFGDCKALREGVQELRIDHGPGYRVMLSRQGAVWVLLLCGSDKGGQARAITQAVALLEDWKKRGKP